MGVSLGRTAQEVLARSMSDIVGLYPGIDTSAVRRTGLAVRHGRPLTAQRSSSDNPASPSR